MSVDAIYTSLSDEDLKICLVEVTILEGSGVLPDGRCRQVIQKVEEFTTDFYPIHYVINSIYREAAYRWLKGMV